MITSSSPVTKVASVAFIPDEDLGLVSWEIFNRFMQSKIKVTADAAKNS